LRYPGVIFRSREIAAQYQTPCIIQDRSSGEWISPQALIAVTQTEWVEKAEQAVTTAKLKKAFRVVNQESQWNLRELAMTVRLDLTNLQPTNASALITRDVHTCDIVTEMVAQRQPRSRL
jgi:thiamine monophosphate synthase